jgi:hypothetical protein
MGQGLLLLGLGETLMLIRRYLPVLGLLVGHLQLLPFPLLLFFSSPPLPSPPPNHFSFVTVEIPQKHCYVSPLLISRHLSRPLSEVNRWTLRRQVIVVQRLLRLLIGQRLLI